MRLDKPLPDAVYRELIELQNECEEIRLDFDPTGQDVESKVNDRVTRMRGRISDLLRASDAAARKP